MATFRFDGADDTIQGRGHSALTGAITFALLFKSGGVSRLHGLVGARTSGGTPRWGFQLESSNTLRVTFTGVASSTSAFAVATNTTDWWIIAFTRAAGSSPVRFHGKNITAGSAWQHDAGSALPNPGTVLGGYVDLGKFSSDLFMGDLALAAWWDGIALTDPQIESFSATGKTSDWNALVPSSLTELNTATPTDLKALETWTVLGPTLAGTNPVWTFDGATPVEPPPETHPPTGGTYQNATGGTIQTIVRGGTPEQPLRGGTPLISTRAGTYDETATGGEVL